MSVDARVARAIIEVRVQLEKHPVAGELHYAIRNLIDETKDALYLDEDDIEGYRRPPTQSASTGRSPSPTPIPPTPSRSTAAPGPL